MLAKFTGERENTNYQHMNIRSERGDITTDPTDINRVKTNINNSMPINVTIQMKRTNS